jgi:cytosine/adenosine deaminase-related metal-dependent hydrolase
MKKISADYIFPGNKPPIKNGVIVVDSDGVILDVLNPTTDKINWEEVEKHEGIICPGFVNTHCHLELSYLKGELSEHSQLPNFVKEIIAVRDNFSDLEREKAIILAEQEMIKNGIVAVGDISNGASTFRQKEISKINYHTFLEIFSLNPDIVDDAIERTKLLKREYHNQNKISITAHSPYSMSPQLMSAVNEVSGNILTIHNQETESENDLFINKSGELYEQLSSFNEDIKEWNPTGENSLPSYLPNFNANKKILLVHNTCTNKEDVAFAKSYSNNIYWCFCPNANEYIEGKQPDYSLFLNEKCTVGTDSLASNWSLSILDELKTISQKDSSIPLETLIKWATINGAQFLGFEQLGSIEKGKTPGLNLIKNIDLDNLNLTKRSNIKAL